MIRTLFKRIGLPALLVAIVVCGSPEMLMSGSNEDMSMLLRRITRTETISLDIAVRLAEMLFERHYGKDAADEQLPLVAIDHGDRWEIQGKAEVPVGRRLKLIIMKVDGRIVNLVCW